MTKEGVAVRGLDTMTEKRTSTMKKHTFGATGRAIAVIGQGSWYIDLADRRLAMDALQLGLDLGMEHIDTAEMYGSGAAEDVIGEAIRGRREQVFLVSKVLPGNASRRGTISACERSLRQLGTDRLDCYLLHWRGSYPLEETFAAFEQLQRDGKIRSYGVSNFDADDLQEAVDVAGPGRLACNQVLYNLKERAIEHSVLPFCRQHDIALVAYSPFGHDDFPKPGTDGRRVLDDIAQAHDATAHQIALAFLTRDASVFAIPKSAWAAHAQANAQAGSIMLTPEEVARIDAAFPLGAEPQHLPMI
jgi:diketogulonate reductase-like aldo/keto reductase